MEWWNGGMMGVENEVAPRSSILPVFHHSIIPKQLVFIGLVGL